MFLTIEELKDKKPCASGYKYFLKNFPNGAEIMDVLNDKNIPTQVVHWGMENLPLSKEEINRANEVLNNVDSSDFYCCSNLKNCSYITNSDFITSSRFVHGSKYVDNSSTVVDSNDVNNSSLVFKSEFVNDSNKVNVSTSIRNSTNINDSSSIIDSRNICESTDILGSGELFRCNNLTDSYFCSNSRDLNNCLFCYDIVGADYYIFNKKVDERRYKAYLEEYKNLMKDIFFDYVEEWYEDPIVKVLLKQNIRWDKHYIPITDRFWKWAKTLPNYDTKILYSITLNSEFLK